MINNNSKNTCTNIIWTYFQAPQTRALLTESAPGWGADCAHSRGTSTVALPWHGRGTAVSRSCHSRVTSCPRRCFFTSPSKIVRH